MTRGTWFLPALSVCLFWLSGCSTIKVASLRDARVLPRGEQEFSLEFSGTGRLETLVADRARDGQPEVGLLADTLGFTGADRGSADGEAVQAGFSYARGFGDGWEAHGGLIVPVLRTGPYLGDLGLKKRLAEGDRTLLSGYGRVAGGFVSSTIPVTFADRPYADHDYQGEARSAEIDLALIGQWRKTQTVSFYASSGPTTGMILWSLEDLSPGPYREGTVLLQGWKNHVGFAIEFRRFELLGEASVNLYDHGTVTAVGFRQSWKAGRKE